MNIKSNPWVRRSSGTAQQVSRLKPFTLKDPNLILFGGRDLGAEGRVFSWSFCLILYFSLLVLLRKIGESIKYLVGLEPVPNKNIQVVIFECIDIDQPYYK